MELQSIKLKPVAPQKSKDTSLINILQQEKELNRRMQQSDIDFWYPSVSDVTYPTLFLPLSPSEAQLLIDIHNSRKSSIISQSSSHLELISSLEKKIEEKITELYQNEENNGIFVKLASRSPKDATNRVEPKYKILKELLEKKREQGGPGGKGLSPNDIICSVFQAHISSFRLYSATEVLETLLHSDRVIMDELPLVLEHRHEAWKEVIVLRKWCNIPIQYEFRGFVFGNILRGVCQYYDEVCYRDLVENREKIRDLILGFFERIKDRIPIEPKEYVLDFLVDLEKEKVYIVEINPFGKPDGMGTGTVMFDLKNPHDYKVLFGEAEFEFRIVMEDLDREKYHGMLSQELKNIVREFE